MLSQRKFRNQEVSALSAGIEALLRRLVRTMIGYISLKKLEELVRLVYVEEVEERLHAEFPDKSVSMSQLGLLTGMDTRQVIAIRNHPNYRQERARDASFMRNFTPTTRLLDKWSTDPRYLLPEGNEPIPIAVHGTTASIEQLMKESGFARGITPKSIADRLVLGGSAVWNDATRQLEMVTERYLPAPDKDEEGAIEVGFNAIGRLMDTVLRNLTSNGANDTRLYQRAYWTNRLAPHRQAELRARLTQLMQEFEEQATGLLIDHEMHIDTPSQVTAGFGLHYFEGGPESRDAP